MSLVKWCFFALLLCGIGESADDATKETAKSYNRLCTSADTPGMCLFKGLLKNAFLYMSSRYNAAAATNKNDTGPPQQSKGIDEYLMEQIQNVLGLFSFEMPAEIAEPWSLLKSSLFNGRGKKNKNLGPMLAAGAAVMAGTMGPMIFGALFMMAGKAMMTSLLAITLSGLLGIKSLFSKPEGGRHKYTAVAPHPHYTEAQFEQDMGLYKEQTEAKMNQGSSANYYGGESNLSSGYYIKEEQQVNAANQPGYYTPVGGGGGGGGVGGVAGGSPGSGVGSGVNPKFGGGTKNHKIIVEKND